MIREVYDVDAIGSAGSGNAAVNDFEPPEMDAYATKAYLVKPVTEAISRPNLRTLNDGYAVNARTLGLVRK